MRRREVVGTPIEFAMYRLRGEIVCEPRASFKMNWKLSVMTIRFSTGLVYIFSGGHRADVLCVVLNSNKVMVLTKITKIL